MFLFENLFDVDDCGIQLLFKEININVLMVVLKGFDEKFKEKFLCNMFICVVILLCEDMEVSGLIWVLQVESEQKVILQVVWCLVDSGEIVLSGGDDVYVQCLFKLVLLVDGGIGQCL